MQGAAPLAPTLYVASPPPSTLQAVAPLASTLYVAPPPPTTLQAVAPLAPTLYVASPPPSTPQAAPTPASTPQGATYHSGLELDDQTPSEYPKEWVYDSQNSEDHLDSFFDHYEHLSKGYVEKGVFNRFLIIKDENGSRQFLSRGYPPPIPQNQTAASTHLTAMIKQTNPEDALEEDQVAYVASESMSEYEISDWVPWEHPNAVARKGDPEKDRRLVERIEDVRVTDAPYEETMKRFSKGIGISNHSETQPEWKTGMLHDKNVKRADCISFSSFQPPGKSSNSLATATSSGHAHVYNRPTNVGLGWGDYDLFREWQSHGRYIPRYMEEDKEWTSTNFEPLEFVSDSNPKNKIIVNDELTVWDESLEPPRSLWEMIDQKRAKRRRGGI